MRLACLLVACSVLGGCATARIVADGSVILDGVDPLLDLDTYDVVSLMELAEQLRIEGHYDQALDVYRRLLRDFPDSPAAAAVRFNMGLIHEGRKAFVASAKLYETIVYEPLPVNDDLRRTWLDAHFRLAVSFGKLGRWWKSVRIFDKLLDHEWMRDRDYLEALAGRGISLHEAGEVETAEAALGAVLRFHREVLRRGYIDDQGLAAEAAFRLGEIATQRYERVRLEFPLDTLKGRLEEKCGHLLSAQNRYIRAIRYGDAHTVAAAGFGIGRLYEALYTEVTEMPSPSELKGEQREVYHEEVYGRVRVLLKKAIMAYEKALLVGRRAASAAPWILRIEASLARLQTLFLAREDFPG